MTTARKGVAIISSPLRTITRQLDKAVGKNGLHVYPVRRGTALTKAINLYAMRRMAEQDIRLPRWEEAKLTPVTKKEGQGQARPARRGAAPSSSKTRTSDSMRRSQR